MLECVCVRMCLCVCVCTCVGLCVYSHLQPPSVYSVLIKPDYSTVRVCLGFGLQIAVSVTGPIIGSLFVVRAVSCNSPPCFNGGSQPWDFSVISQLWVYTADEVTVPFCLHASIYSPHVFYIPLSSSQSVPHDRSESFQTQSLQSPVTQECA